MAKFAKGTVVRQAVPQPLAGTVVGYEVDQESGDVQVKVEWTTDDGAVHSRHWREDQLEAVPPAPAA